MTDHRTTEHVIEAIDHALDDCTVSGDAMRWSPAEPLADWEKALTAHPFDPDDPALRGIAWRDVGLLVDGGDDFARDRLFGVDFARGRLFEWSTGEPSDAAEPQSLPPHHRHVHVDRDGQVHEPQAVSIGFADGGLVPGFADGGRGWGRQAALDRARQDELVREQLADLAETFGRNIAPFVEWAERAAAQMGMALAEWQRQVLALVAAMRPDLTGLSIATEPDDEDLRDRALRLRRERNTGPSRDRTRQRRPRTHQ